MKALWVVHILAAFFFTPALFLTIPMHVLISVLKGKK